MIASCVCHLPPGSAECNCSSSCIPNRFLQHSELCRQEAAQSDDLKCTYSSEAEQLSIIMNFCIKKRPG